LFVYLAEEGDIFLLFIYIYIFTFTPNWQPELAAFVGVFGESKRGFAGASIVYFFTDRKQFYTYSTNVLSCSKRLLYYVEKTENWNYAIIFFIFSREQLI